MQIYGPAHLHGVHGVTGPHAASAARAPEPANIAAPRDEVQISDAGRFVDQARALPEMRMDRVQELRAALANGTYDVDARLELTVQRILDELA